MTKPAFRQCFRSRRCLIPADGFYEWARLQPKKRPFHFGLEDGGLFAFAGLWDQWQAPDGTPVQSCTILTTAPNSLVADLHNRMPVILPREHYQAWLSESSSEAARLAELLQPFDASLMSWYEVSPVVNNARNETPDCIAPLSTQSIH